MRCWLRSSTRFNAKPVQPPQAGHSALGTGWLRIIARSALSAYCEEPQYAQFERELIRERQREGIALAKKRGAYRGRKRSLTAAQASDLLRRIAQGESKTLLAQELGVTRDTIYQYMARAGK